MIRCRLLTGVAGSLVPAFRAMTARAFHPRRELVLTDAKLAKSTSESDLLLLGLSVEVVARWPIDDRGTVYASLGPAMAIGTLDTQRIIQAQPVEEDDRSISPGA